MTQPLTRRPSIRARDRFLEDAFEFESMRRDRRRGLIGGIMEHIEEAGIHSATVVRVPPFLCRRHCRPFASNAPHRPRLGVVGLMNVQFAPKTMWCTCSR